MGKPKGKNGKQDTILKIVILLTALVNLIKAVIDLITNLTR